MPDQAAHTSDIDNGIVAIDTEYVRPLLDASHLIVEDGRAAFVDTGTNDSVPLLLDALRQKDLDPGDVDFVFLTHVHLDHAGGAGQLMQRLPNARCVIHPRGAPHMIEPAKLIAGTEAVYGKKRTREMYGEIQPIAADRVIVAADEQAFVLNGREMRTLHTEGHARHHYCLHDPQSQGVFTGDSFGVSYRELDTAAGEFIFPSSTPPHFDPAEAHKTIDRIVALEPRQCYLTHYSRVGDLDRLAGDMHECIDGYVAIADECRDDRNRSDSMQTAMFDFLSGRLAKHGFRGDRDAMWSVLKIDVMLNAQGLDAWLKWRQR